MHILSATSFSFHAARSYSTCDTLVLAVPMEGSRWLLPSSTTGAHSVVLTSPAPSRAGSMCVMPSSGAIAVLTLPLAHASSLWILWRWNVLFVRSTMLIMSVMVLMNIVSMLKATSSEYPNYVVRVAKICLNLESPITYISLAASEQNQDPLVPH